MSYQNYRRMLLAQIKECYGKLLYTYVTHQKQHWLLALRQNTIKLVQIFLSSVSTVGFLSIAITNQTTLSVVAGISSVLSLALNLYSREANLSDRIERHRRTVNKLWPIQQDYLSLMADFWGEMPTEVVVQKRNELQERTDAVYQDSPRTGKLAYMLASRALKKGEQSFTTKEIDSLLPLDLRVKL